MIIHLHSINFTFALHLETKLYLEVLTQLHLFRYYTKDVSKSTSMSFLKGGGEQFPRKQTLDLMSHIKLYRLCSLYTNVETVKLVHGPGLANLFLSCNSLYKFLKLVKLSSFNKINMICSLISKHINF